MDYTVNTPTRFEKPRAYKNLTSTEYTNSGADDSYAKQKNMNTLDQKFNDLKLGRDNDFQTKKQLIY